MTDITIYGKDQTVATLAITIDIEGIAPLIDVLDLFVNGERVRVLDTDGTHHIITLSEVRRVEASGE